MILAGMRANLCVESHQRELLEQGFEIAVVDATAGPRHPVIGGGYAAALVNYGHVSRLRRAAVIRFIGPPCRNPASIRTRT